MPRMRDGSSVRDERLGRLVGHQDRRSFELYAVTERLEAVRKAQRKGKTWRRGAQLNQIGGSCVGFSLGTERAADPAPVAVTDEECLALYRRAQELDPWPETGPGREEGTSILAGAKAGVEAGWFDRYEWCLTVDDTVDVLTLPTKGAGERYGPLIAGVAWTHRMSEPDEDGFIEPTGQLEGGHAICIRGVRLAAKRHGKPVDEPVFVLTNTWGPGYGDDGEVLMTASSFERAADPGGGNPFEVYVPIRRTKKRAA